MSTSVRLNTGYLMPLIGLGTYKIRGQEVVHTAIDAALKTGYRSIDSAAGYHNETDIGTCLKDLLPKYGLKREDIFITTKLGPKDQGKGKCYEACLKSLSNLDCGYLDLYLIHWPAAQGLNPEDDKNRNLRMGSWQDMIQLVKDGKVRSIGVSNFLQHHMDDIIEETSTVPAVLQIEHHPHLVQTDLIKYCKNKGILFQAYSSLGTTTDTNKVLSDPTILDIAKKKGKLPSQILLRWAVQEGVGVIPKSSNPTHIAENFDIFSFELSDEEVALINGLDDQKHYCWNPHTVK